MTNILQDIQNWFKVAEPEPTNREQQIELGFLLKCIYDILQLHTLHIGDDCRWVFTAYMDKGLDIAKLSEEFKRTKYNLSVYAEQSLAEELAKTVFNAFGVAHSHGIDLIGALQEVNRSNWSKFENGKPVFDENGKITKGKDYTPPELSKFVRE